MAANSNDPRSPQRSGYIPTLDGWRAIAVIMVMLGHSPDFPTGTVFSRVHALLPLGVDIFFAISGILICSRLIAEEKRFGRIDIAAFYVRRLFRIFPALYGYLAVIALVTAVLHWAPIDWPSWTASVFFYRNYYSAFTPDSYPGRLTGHLWSLALEEHFYLILPAVLVAFPRKRVQVLAALTTLSFLWLSLYLYLTAPADRLEAWYHRTDLRLHSLLFPALLALLLADPRISQRFKTVVTVRSISFTLLLFVGLGLIKHFALPHPPDPPLIENPLHPGLYLQPVQPANPITVFVVPLFFPFVVLATAFHPLHWLSRVLEWSPLRAVGRLSYSLYLWHVLFSSAQDYAPWFVYRFVPLYYRVPLTLLFATGGYFLIEKPAIRLGHRLVSNRPEPPKLHANAQPERLVAS